MEPVDHVPQLFLGRTDLGSLVERRLKVDLVLDDRVVDLVESGRALEHPLRLRVQVLLAAEGHVEELVAQLGVVSRLILNERRLEIFDARGHCHVHTIEITHGRMAALVELRCNDHVKVAIPTINELPSLSLHHHTVILLKINRRHPLLPPLLHNVIAFRFVHGVSQLLILLQIFNFALRHSIGVEKGGDAVAGEVEIVALELGGLAILVPLLMRQVLP